MQIVATERNLNEDGNQSVVRFFNFNIIFYVIEFMLCSVSVDFNFLILSSKNQRDRWM